MSKVSPNDKLSILNIHTQGGGVGYYRHFMPSRALQLAGHYLLAFRGDMSFFMDIEAATGKKAEDWLYDNACNFDVVHIGYTANMNQVAAAVIIRNMALERFNKEIPVIVDIDDDPLHVPPYNTGFKTYSASSDNMRVLMMQLRSADACTVTTPALEQALRDESKNFTVLPNYCQPADWDHFPRDPRRDDDKAVRLLFTGGPGHLGDLATMEAQLQQLLREMDGKEGRPLLRVFFLGCTPRWMADWMPSKTDPMANRTFYIQPCHYETYWRAIRWLSPDILVAPVEMNLFNESKSLIKAYDAVIGNSAFVCTDWTTYDEVPKEGCSKVRGDVQWYETLKALILDPSLRQRKAAALREWVFDSRVISNYTYKWIAAYEEALKRPVIKEIGDVIRPRIIRDF